MMRGILGGLLGTAAAIAVVPAAQAADLPVKAKPVEYVKICSAYGAGFYYIPGTDICLRVGGAVRADYYHNSPGAFPDIGFGGGSSTQSTATTVPISFRGRNNTRNEETHGLRGRGYLILDARNNTAYGTLRAYLNMYFSTDTSSAGESKSGTHDRAFIQWAGFTFGLAASFFDFYGSTGPFANLVSWNGATTGATGWNVLAYTAQFGNGVSATISIEDQRRKPITDDFVASTGTPGGAATLAFGGDVRAGQNLPALVGNIRVDQSWGSAQIMGAVQELRTNETVLPTLDSYGWAVGGGFTWNNPSAPGSVFGIQAGYGKGATGYAIHSYGGHNIWDGGPGAGSASLGLLTDAVVVGGTTLHKTTAWGFNAGYQHRFNPQWAWTIHGGYSEVNYNGAVEAAAGGAVLDFSFWSLGSRLLWTPVSGLNLGLDVMYHDFETQGVTSSMTAATPGTLRNNDVWAAMFRVQRDF